MQPLSFQEVSRIQVLVGHANEVIASKKDLLEKLGLKSATMPVEVREGAFFRTRVETAMGALYEAAKFRAANLPSPDEVGSDAELLDIIHTMVSLNGGLGHEKIREIAKRTSTNPQAVKLAKDKLEKLVKQFSERMFLEGRNVMDIIRHVSSQQKQCLFSA